MRHAISFSLSPNKSSLTNHFCEAWQTAQSWLLWEVIRDSTREINVNTAPGEDMPVTFHFNKYENINSMELNRKSSLSVEMNKSVWNKKSFIKHILSRQTDKNQQSS